MDKKSNTAQFWQCGIRNLFGILYQKQKPSHAGHRSKWCYKIDYECFEVTFVSKEKNEVEENIFFYQRMQNKTCIGEKAGIECRDLNETHSPNCLVY